MMSKRIAWRYHKDYKATVFEGEALEIAERAGWVDSPAKVNDADNENTSGGNDNTGGGDNTSGDNTQSGGDGDETPDYTDSKWTKKLLKVECNDKGIDFSHLGAKPKNDELIALLKG